MRTIEVLLVDDNPADVDLISEVLARRKGVHITAVSDGVAAISFFRAEGIYANAQPPDFVILDLSLPMKDGRVVLAEVKADPVLRNIPISIFSTSEARQDILRSYELGANCYVRKPGNLAEFCASVALIASYWLELVRLPCEAMEATALNRAPVRIQSP